MRRGLVSDSPTGRHPNARKGAGKVNASGSQDDAGQAIPRHHEHGSRANVGLVMDSPPYEAPYVPLCAAIRKDGQPCRNEVNNAGEKCFGHKAGAGGRG